MQPRLRLAHLVLASLALLALAADAADAQYFGRNKVQWEEFDFQVLETEHFDIYYYPADHPAIEDVARMAERWYRRLAAAFDHEFAERKPIVLYADHPDFQQTTVTGGLIGEGTGGFTEPLKNRVVMPLTGSYAETDHVLGHELVHAFQFDIAQRLARQRRQGSRILRLPLWMVEGLAEYLSQGRVDAQTAMWLRDAALHERLPGLTDLTRDRRFSPYQYGQAFWAYVGGRWDDRTAVRLFLTAGVIGIEPAFEQVLGLPAEQFFTEWQAAVAAAYGPLLEARAEPSARARRVLSEETTRGDVNIAPVLSPDGRQVAFLSTRGLFSIDLYLADADTGEVSRRLVSASSNPHFDALRFLDSAGSWSPDGRKLAFVVTERGDSKLAILDVDSGRVERRIDAPAEVGAISSPAWSPDGGTIAFSGSSAGLSDLWVFHLASGELRRLTDDRHADLQPAWSPDGSKLAFVSDRGRETDFRTLAYQPMGLAVLDLASREIEVLRPFEGAKHINPQFSPDGRELYFIADPEGVSDVFRLSLAGGPPVRVTRVKTGVTGITDLSPALSVASRSGRLMYSVLEDGVWNVYGEEPGGEPVPATAAATAGIANAAVLPPGSSADPAEPAGAETQDLVASYLASPSSGLLPPEAEFPVGDYQVDLSLDYLGPPTVGVGADSFGLGVGGSVSAYFSDTLGEHQVGVAFEGGTSTGDFGTLFGGQVFYLNREDRLQWGVSGTHLPFVSARTFIGQEVVDLNGTPVVADRVEQVRQQTTLDEVSLISHYPLSLNRRLEAAVGYTRLGFEAEVERVLVFGNRIVDRTITDLPTAPDLDYYQTSLAYVGDTSFFGFTGPVSGGRHRFEVEGTFGDLQFQTALADYRRYLFRNPVTFAVRAMHYGRYGSDAESPRLQPLYLGRSTLVRGYEIDSFALSECTRPEGSNACPEFDRLIGSRLGIVNLELRVPILGTEDYGLVEFPFLPTDLVLFADAGGAWTADESLDVTYATDTAARVPVVSAGIAARMVLGGYVPIQLYYAWPFQRPEEDAVFGFTIAPAW